MEHHHDCVCQPPYIASIIDQLPQICALAYSPNGLHLATASDDGTVAIWNVATGERMSHLPPMGHGGCCVRAINWSPDSQRIVTAALDNRIRLFDVKTGTPLCEPLAGHVNTPTVVAFRSSMLHDDLEVISGARHFFHPRSHRLTLLSASLDGTARVWELGNFMETRTFPKRHRDWVRPYISPEGFNLRIYSDPLGCHFTCLQLHCVRRR
jgi:WD40 repeat protein